MRVPRQYVPEEGAAGGDDHLVGADLLVLTHQRHVHKVLHRAELPDAGADVGLVIIPAETEFIR